NGFILVTYTNAYSATDDDIRGRVYDQSGNLITVDGGSDFVPDAANLNERQSSIAALTSGRFVTTWTDAQGDGPGNGDRISGRVQELTRSTKRRWQRQCPDRRRSAPPHPRRW